MIKTATYTTLACLVVFLLTLMLLDSIAREDEGMVRLRQQRCARFGEHLPREWRQYCKNTGV